MSPINRINRFLVCILIFSLVFSFIDIPSASATEDSSDTGDRAADARVMVDGDIHEEELSSEEYCMGPNPEDCGDEGEEDWFSIQMNVDYDLIILFENTAEDCFNWDIYNDEEQQQTGGEICEDSLTLLYRVEKAGDVYIRLNNEDGDNKARNYRITLSVRPYGDDAGDTRLYATPLTDGDEIWNRAGENSDEQDWYKTQVTDGDQVHYSISVMGMLAGSSGPDSVRIELYDDEGIAIPESAISIDYGQTASPSITVNYSGNIYLKLEPGRDSESIPYASYRISISIDSTNTNSGGDDSDNDGVDDATDLCSNTPTGASVDANGCADSQKDSDNDGVDDATDLCPNTPTGASVDATGCADSQKDSDNDVDFEGDDSGECGDGADNDQDGLFDCNDPDCTGSPDCASGDDVSENSGLPGVGILTTVFVLFVAGIISRRKGTVGSNSVALPVVK
jgi:hypothetical protein